jgi:putative acetyltransferase
LPGSYACILLHDRGCVALRPFAPEVLELKRLFVYPAFRGRGIGAGLLHAAMQWARANGYRRIHLDTLKTRMPSAVRMYKALGFVEVPAGGGMRMPDLIDMELDLAHAPPVKRGSE